MFRKLYTTSIHLVLTMFLLSACGGATATQPIADTKTPEIVKVTEAPPTATETVVPTNTISPAFSASLTELQGNVAIKNVGDADFVPAVANQTLWPGGQIQTGDDGRARLDLSSGTVIRVSPSSLFTLVSNETVDDSLKTKLELLVGRVFIVLNGGSLDVNTGSGVASVRGSYMMVELDPNTLDVLITCLEGDCSGENPAGLVLFTTGQKTVLLHHDPVTGAYTAPGVGSMSAEDFKKWLDEHPELKDFIDQISGASDSDDQHRQNPRDDEGPADEPPATEPPCMQC